MVLAATGKKPDAILEDDYLEIITGLGTEPRIIQPNGNQRINRFAFVIHPLSQEYFKKVKPIKPKASRDRSAETFLIGIGLK